MSKREVWRSIPGYSRYQASSYGRVRRKCYVYRTPPGLVAVGMRPDGYPTVSITGDDGVNRKIYLHKAVCSAFKGLRPDGLQVRHLNGDKLDARPANLSYGTSSENKQDSIRHGTLPMGEDHYGAKLTIADALVIYARCATRERQDKIAADYGVNQGTISNICRRKTWKCLGLPRLDLSSRSKNNSPACAGFFETRRR